jgi:hypothetical protein
MNDRHGASRLRSEAPNRTRLIDCAQTAGGFGRRCFILRAGTLRARLLAARDYWPRDYCPTNMKGTWVTVSPKERGNVQPFTASSMQWAKPG